MARIVNLRFSFVKTGCRFQQCKQIRLVMCCLVGSLVKTLFPQEIFVTSVGDLKLNSKCHKQLNRVHTGPGKSGKSWNFIVAFSRTEKSWKKASGPWKGWKSVWQTVRRINIEIL